MLRAQALQASLCMSLGARAICYFLQHGGGVGNAPREWRALGDPPCAFGEVGEKCTEGGEVHRGGAHMRRIRAVRGEDSRLLAQE